MIDLAAIEELSIKAMPFLELQEHVFITYFIVFILSPLIAAIFTSKHSSIVGMNVYDVAGSVLNAVHIFI